MQNKSHVVLAVNCLFLSLTWLTFGLRCFVRAVIIRSFGKDDWVMAVAQLIFTAYIISGMISTAHGIGRHVNDLTPENVRIALKFWYICELLYVSCATVLKAAVGLFLLRVSVQRLHAWILYIAITTTAAFGTIYFFLVLFQCRPISAWWEHGIGSQYCMSPRVILDMTYAASALNSLDDWIFGTLPILMVWNLSIARRQKILVVCILAFAAIGSIATIVRIPLVSTLGDMHDFLWNTTDMAILTTVEMGVGITAACIATLRPLVSRFLGSSTRHSKGSIPLNDTAPPKCFRPLKDRLPCRRPSSTIGNVTTIMGPDSCEELFHGKGVSINKSIEVTYNRFEIDLERGEHSNPRWSELGTFFDDSVEKPNT